MPAFLARTRSRALVEAYESTPLRRSDDIVRFASWSLDAGTPAEPDLLLRAARRALEGADLRATERFAAAAVDQLTLASTSPGSRATGVAPNARPGAALRDAAPSGSADDLIAQQTRATLVLADALGRQGRLDDASAVLDRAHPRAPVALAARVVELQSRGLFLGDDARDGRLVSPRGKQTAPTRALALLEDAEGRFEDLHARLRLRIARASLLLLLGRPLDSLELLDPMATPTLELEHRWLAQRGTALAWTGHFDRAEDAIERALALPETDLAPPAISWIPMATTVVALGRGELASSEATVRGVLDHAKSLRNRTMQRTAATLLGCCLLQQGRVSEAIELLVIDTDEGDGPDQQGALGLLAFGALASAHAWAGDAASARSTLDRAGREARTPARIGEPTVALGYAITARALGLQRQSRDALRDGLIQCRDSGSHVLEVFLALAACQIGAAELAAEFTIDLVTKVDGGLAVVAHDWATASLACDVDRLETVSQTLEDLGLLLHAAHAASAAADIRDAAGRATQAIAGRARARWLLDRCPGADDAFLRRSGNSSTLTARELEIARLAAAGLSSAEIAKGLYLSSPTVETHLGRVYVKLDVQGQAELKDHPQLTPRAPSTRTARLSPTGRARRSGR